MFHALRWYFPVLRVATRSPPSSPDPPQVFAPTRLVSYLKPSGRGVWVISRGRPVPPCSPHGVCRVCFFLSVFLLVSRLFFCPLFSRFFGSQRMLFRLFTLGVVRPCCCQGWIRSGSTLVRHLSESAMLRHQAARTRLIVGKVSSGMWSRGSGRDHGIPRTSTGRCSPLKKQSIDEKSIK